MLDMENQLKLTIKNMVCPRCIEAVSKVFEDLNHEISSITLGEVTTLKPLNNTQKEQLSLRLKKNGFELINTSNTKVIIQIKALIIEEIHHNIEKNHINFSSYLSSKLNQDYSFLSKLFSTMEGNTIEQFILKQKVEKVKELLTYNELNVSEIAIEMNYSSVSHLSYQFKKLTGITPSQFKKLNANERQNLDSL